MASALAKQLGLPCGELDQLFWNDHWVPTESSDFRSRVAHFISQPAWILDGNYRGEIFDLVFSAADTMVWLDLPRRVVLYRCARRSIRMLFKQQNFYGKKLPPTILGCVRHLRYVWKTFNERNVFLNIKVREFDGGDRQSFTLKSVAEIDALLSRLKNGSAF